MKNQKNNGYGGMFSMKHNARQIKNAFTILSNTALCEEQQSLDIFFHHVGAGLEKAIHKRFESAQKTFKGENVLK